MATNGGTEPRRYVVIIASETLYRFMKRTTTFKRIWYSYDEEADVLYLNFKKPGHADDSELTEDDIIIRYEKGKVIGITVLHASKRKVAMSL